LCKNDALLKYQECSRNNTRARARAHTRLLPVVLVFTCLQVSLSLSPLFLHPRSLLCFGLAFTLGWFFF